MADLQEGSVTSEGSVLSRFALKFLEVFAAGLATAGSGYMIAHFAGYFAATTPTAAVIQPPAVQLGTQSGPAAPIAKEAAPASLPQSNMADQSPSKARETAKDAARDTAESKPRDAAKGPNVPSFEARMRAAIDKAGPAAPASNEVPRRQAAAPTDAVPRLSNTATRPLDTPADSIAAAPPPNTQPGRTPPSDSASRSAPAEPPTGTTASAVENTAAVPPAIQLAPPPTVEIKSQPVASVDANQPAPAAAQPPSTEGRGNPLTALAKGLHIDKLLSRDEPPRPPDQPPRPPLPVGE
jgi:hypothetical protein